jgi:3',5'-cyclic AMP phosphodiesterase CpdA
MSDSPTVPHDHDGIDRRGFLNCMAWAGAAVVWSVRAGALASSRVGLAATPRLLDNADFTFVQLSDSHIGFHKEPNQDVVGTLQIAVNKINALPKAPDLLIHTGDLTHGADPKEFDSVAEILKSVRTGRTLYVPGEHDITTDGPGLYLERFGKSARGDGWHSFDHKGVHFIGLVNVIDHSDTQGLGQLGKPQLQWLENDVKGLSADTPIVVFAHVPLWTVYEKWGWGTKDADVALGFLKRFGSVTVLNGHIHQALQKTEGKVTFHTARSTAFPQPEPGKAEKPGPVKNIAADKLKSTLGLATVNYVEHPGSLAIVDSTLEG